MVEYIINKGKSIEDNKDKIYSAFGDWLVLCEQAGFRRKNVLKIVHILQNIKIFRETLMALQ